MLVKLIVNAYPLSPSKIGLKNALPTYVKLFYCMDTEILWMLV